MTDHLFKLRAMLRCIPTDTASLINDHLKAKAYFARRTVSLAYPTVFEIETTNRYGMTCDHCPQHSFIFQPSPDMSLDLLRKTVDQIELYANRGAVLFVYHGGSSSYLHSGEAIRQATARGLKVTISSVASAFHDNAIREAVEFCLQDLWLLFDGMDEDVSQKIRGKGASFKTGLEQLKKLISYKREKDSLLPRLQVVMIRHSANRHQWEHFKTFFSEMDGVHVKLAHFSSFADNGDGDNTLQRQIADDVVVAAERLRAASLNAHVCFYPWHSISVLSDGRVVPCCRDVDGACVLGNLNTESLADIWNGERIQELRWEFAQGNRNNSLCARCREGSFEIGVPDPLCQKEGRRLLRTHILGKPGKATRFLRQELDEQISVADSVRFVVQALLPRSTRLLLKIPPRIIQRLWLRVALLRLRLSLPFRRQPVSRTFGVERGKALDRHYIEAFLSKHQMDIRRRVLEIGEATYTCRFGGDRVTCSDVLHVTDDNPHATLVGNLETGAGIPEDAYDCVILTQTLPVIFDVHAAVIHAWRTLKENGVLLGSVPGISQISRYDMDRWGHYWLFTDASISRLLGDVFGKSQVSVETHGNVKVASAFLYGLGTHDLSRADFDFRDPDYQVVIAFRAVKKKENP